ncbi:MAG: hypothetical protein IJJ60_11685 [Clostridia bacterium]|nr:hypothetical protein [Clostridia bacterium]
MNGTNTVRIPRFLEGEPLPAGYFDPPNPYADPPVSKYNLRAMVNYALRTGKKVTDLTKEEADQFLIQP